MTRDRTSSFLVFKILNLKQLKQWRFQRHDPQKKKRNLSPLLLVWGHLFKRFEESFVHVKMNASFERYIKKQNIYGIFRRVGKPNDKFRVELSDT